MKKMNMVGYSVISLDIEPKNIADDMIIKFVKVRDVYEQINSDGLIVEKFNTRKFRREFKILLKKRLMEHGVTHFDIKCDEENNTPEIVEELCLVARVSWVNENKEIYYSDLIFGDPKYVEKVKLLLL